MRFARIALSLFVLSGCTHPLEIKNLSQYRPTSINPLTKRVSIGIVSTEQDALMKSMVKSVGDELQKYSSEVILPYDPKNGKHVDVLADVRVTPEYKGSGANFLVNFPGFLVWAPAWHGYNYKVKYLIDVNLVDQKKNEKIDQFLIPIALDVRHAQMDRTWTEISWLEVGFIALIGGIYCTNYDPDVTPLVAAKAASTVGENIASEIINRINNSKRFARIFLLDPDSRLANLFDVISS
jgi:hypothetical protein